MKKLLLAAILVLSLGGLAVAQSSTIKTASVKKEHKMAGKGHHKHKRHHKHGHGAIKK